MLECKKCGHRNNNLVPHIETEHEGLKEYMSEFKVGIEGVIAPELRGETKAFSSKAKATKKPVKAKAKAVKSIECDSDLVSAIPKTDSGYQFPELAVDVVNDYQQVRPVMLIGHTGTGKTSMIEQLAAKIKQPTIRANMNGQTSVSDFVGYHGAKAGETHWVDGALPYAMRKGLWLIIDEIDYADAEILSVLNAVLEPNGSLVLKENGHEVIKPHENFRIFATANAAGALAEYRSLYQGTNIMNEAFLDRWWIYIVDYMPPALEAKVLVEKVDKMSLGAAKLLVEVANLARSAFQAEELQATFSTRRLINWADGCIYHAKHGDKAAIKAAESTIFSKVSREDKHVLEGLMQRVLLGKDK